MITCTCSICGVQFKSRQSNSHVCAQQSCRRQYKRAIEKKYVARMSPERRARMLARKSAYERGRKKYRPEQRACEMCGAMFTPRNSLNVNCSQVCTQKARHLKADMRDEKLMAFRSSRNRTCVHCGAPFVARVNKQLTCSKDCGYKLRLSRQHKKRVNAASENGLVLNGRNSTKKYFSAHTCAICGTEFRGSNNAKFCSDECRRTNHNRKYYRHTATQRKEKNCAQCGRLFTPRKRTDVTCGVECRKMRLKIEKRRIAHAAWVAGAATRAAQREERQQQRALRAPVKRAHTFVVSSTIACPACDKHIERSAAIAGCCSRECVDALAHRVTVKSLTDRVAVGERVLVTHYARMILGEMERMVCSGDAGQITQIVDGAARIIGGGNEWMFPVDRIAITETIVQSVRRKLDQFESWRTKAKKHHERIGAA